MEPWFARAVSPGQETILKLSGKSPRKATLGAIAVNGMSLKAAAA